MSDVPTCETPRCAAPALVIVSDGRETALACALCHEAMLRASGGVIRGIGLVPRTPRP
ncbi:hypothetical protein ThrDRAFT_04190 [Frankia casuarinae]|nr:hypothetical protein CcI6DRAFT_04759 [Frankia sp. CcI6]EYT90200.1 hypothetical protein ThrDRAFT_04190 [Frankia casuarinae]KDA40621.1 hypothetical protein BMG523Draft_04563 [Frankia sp. BMG5.23]KEZ34249.1 hypothetical protein CEDDRAFT_04402 [Frankia sp. CeD]KFB04628.1 hypothetical protein ALLO2DRAFT_02557 [Frankia sp. Allo2]